jgi:hypothetical protein
MEPVIAERPLPDVLDVSSGRRPKRIFKLNAHLWLCIDNF